MDLLLDGHLTIGDTRREGQVTIDFDTFEAHPDLKAGANVDRTPSC